MLIPSQAIGGEWRIVVAARDGRTDPQEIATIRVADAAMAPGRYRAGAFRSTIAIAFQSFIGITSRFRFES